MEKKFITAQELLKDSFRLAKIIFDSGFRPNFIAALWRGGTPVGIAVQEFLAYKGIQTDHIPIRTSAYECIGKKGRHIRVHGLDYLVQNANNNDKLLIVDDVFDTGASVEAVIQQLSEKSRANTPSEIKIATVYYKPKPYKVKRIPDFYVHETKKWLVFPHELQGLTIEEIISGKGSLAEFLK